LGRDLNDTSEPSLRQGKTYPVVSFSIGDAVDFSMGEGGDRSTVRLRSGDVLLFGGNSRTIKHGVARTPTARGPRPAGLRMVSGRLNITLRRL
jgi:alkylated DNA repair protein (DNA oxidative demethylase)